MKIHNVRLGYATNSSSSHSIIFDPSIGANYDDADDFGWNFFTASTRESKDQYMACMLRQNLDGDFPEAIITAIIKGLGLPDNEPSDDGYGFRYTKTIDHQSLYNLPKEFGFDHVSLEFFNEFREYLLQDGYHILGGNDNCDEDHHLLNGNEIDLGGWRPESENIVCRKDGDWWTLYGKRSGNRLVLTFNDNAAPYAPVTPMLMDIKITDFCTHGCAYCYQGSTKNGEHMNPKELWSYAGMVAEAKVFEVAIGGGEPTQCPHFDQYIEMLHNQGVVVNFTTKSTDWLEDEKRAEHILKHIGAFAFSVDGDTMPKLDRIYDILKYRGWTGYGKEKLTLQVVPATVSAYQLETTLTWAAAKNIRVTLLGYKESGRGAKFKEIGLAKSWGKFNEGEWLGTVAKLNKEKKLGRLSIDTTLASKYEAELKELGLPDWLYHTKEGQYSMYLDLVQMKYGPSSYHIDKLEPFTLHRISVEEMFALVDPV